MADFATSKQDTLGFIDHSWYNTVIMDKPELNAKPKLEQIADIDQINVKYSVNYDGDQVRKWFNNLRDEQGRDKEVFRNRYMDDEGKLRNRELADDPGVNTAISRIQIREELLGSFTTLMAKAQIISVVDESKQMNASAAYQQEQ